MVVCEKILVASCCHSLLGCEETHPRRTVDGPLRAVVTQDGGIQKERQGRLFTKAFRCSEKSHGIEIRGMIYSYSYSLLG